MVNIGLCTSLTGMSDGKIAGQMEIQYSAGNNWRMIIIEGLCSD